VTLAVPSRKLAARSTPAKESPAQVLSLLVEQAPSLSALSARRLEQAVTEVVKQPAKADALLLVLDDLRAAVLSSFKEAGRPAGRPSRVKDNVPALAREGALLASAAFAQKIGWTRQALSKALATRRVFYVESGNERHFPAFYADPRYERRQLEAVTKLLGDLPGGSKWQFFTTPKGSLSRLTPLQALEKGMLAQVKAAAEAFAER